jgi:outer membrane receptor for ferrienterochelin and colicins
VAGTVIDVEGNPVPEASVTASPSKVSDTADVEGRFCLEGLPAGRQMLLAHHPESGDTRSVVTLEPGADPLEVTLTLTDSFRDEVVVTATRTEQRLEDVPVRVQLVPKEAVEQTAARTLAEAVELSTGVRTENNCQNCNFSQIRMLGLAGPYTQILIDGQPILSGLSMVYGIEHIPAQLIDRLEIVKGGGSALYGPGSVAGVVNVVTEQPHETRGNLQVRHGWSDSEPQSTLDGGFDWASADGRTAVTAYGQSDDMDAIDVDGDGFSDQGRREMEAFGARVYRDVLAQDGQLVFDFGRMTESRRGGDNLDAPFTDSQVAEAVDTERTSLAATWSHRPTKGFWYRLTASHSSTDRETYYGAGGDPNAFGSTRNPLTVLDAQATFTIHDHMLTAGAQYERDSLRDTQPAYDRVLDEAYENVGVFVQDEWSIGNTWSFLGGLRADDHSELENSIVSPRLAVRYKPSRSLNIRFSWATGFLAPEVFNEDLHIEIANGSAQVIRNDPNLEEEGSSSYSLGAEWFPTSELGQVRVEANLFYTDIRDSFQVVQRDDPGTPEQTEFVRTNGSGSEVYGIELNTGLVRSGLFSLDAGIVLQRARFDVPEPDFGSLRLLRTPQVTGVASFTWRAWRPWELFVGMKYTGQMKVPHYAGFIPEDRLESAEPFLTLDANISRRIPLSADDSSALVLKLGAKNLTDEYQEDLDRGPDRDAGYVYGPRFPRTVYTSAKLEF